MYLIDLIKLTIVSVGLMYSFVAVLAIRQRMLSPLLDGEPRLFKWNRNFIHMTTVLW